MSVTRSTSAEEWQHDPAGLGARLPAGFRVGVATSAFQIEGAVRDGGREPSTWDTFMGQRGRILDGSTAAIATDHYNRSSEDVRLMRELGVDSYRFSLSWPRLQPGGKGPANRAGLAFYDRLLDELLAAGIRPMATLYHWDTPEPLQHVGGWLKRDTAYRFAEYAFLAGEAFGDRVESWVTINEPATVTLNGYALGLHAPGATLLFDALPTAHNQLLGHGLAVAALRDADVSGAIGITNVHSPVEPAGDREDDAIFAQLFDILHNRIFADPVLLGRYPEIPEPFEDLFAFARELDPDDYRIYLALARTRRHSPGYPNANDLATWSLAVELAPQVGAVRWEAAEAFSRAGQNETAIALLLPLASDPHGGPAAARARIRLESLRPDGEATDEVAPPEEAPADAAAVAPEGDAG